MLLEICIKKFEGREMSKVSKFKNFYNELKIDEGIRKNLKDFDNVTFNIFENNINFFEKEKHENEQEFD